MNEKGQLLEPSIDFSWLERFFPPHVAEKIPGILLTAIISALALYTSSRVSYVSPLVAAMGIGMIIRNFFIVPRFYFPGIFFAMRPVLRLGIVLLGAKITLEKVLGLGWQYMVIPALSLLAGLFFVYYLGRLFGISKKMSLLLGMGTSICGASAVLVGGSLVKAKEEDTIVSISAITVFGTLSMLIYPLLYTGFLHFLNPEEYGLWVGASIHEVAQVVTAGFSAGKDSGEVAVLTKLVRVILMLPLAFILSVLVGQGFFMEKKEEETRRERVLSFPLFLLGFAGVVILNSMDFFTPKAQKWMEFSALFFLLMGMAGMGLETDFRRLLRIGFAPFFVGLISTLFMSAFSLFLIWFLR